MTLTLDALRAMTGPEILRLPPGELDALAAEVMGWRLSDAGPAWSHGEYEMWVDQVGRIKEWKKDYVPTTDANQTRKLVEAVGDDRSHIFDNRMFFYTGNEPSDGMGAYDAWDAPLPLVTAAAVIAMGEAE